MKELKKRLQALEARRRVPSEAYNRICDEELAARLMEDPDSPAGGLAGNLTNRELALLLLNRTPPAPRRDGWNYIDPLPLPPGKERLFNKAKLLESFQKYCKETNVPERKIPRTLKALSTIVFKNGFKDVRRGTTNKREYYYEALRTWKEESPYYQTEEQEKSQDRTLEGILRT